MKKKVYCELGVKTGRLLARASKDTNSTNNITGIRSQNGTLAVTSEAIAAHFLYNLPHQHKPPMIPNERGQGIQDYLNKSGLPQLAETEVSLLEDQISLAEIQLAIKGLKPGKSPGPVGYTSAYYKTFSNILSTPLMGALNSLSSPRQVPPDFLSAHVALIPKVDKDTTDCSNYRPISLLNLDLKLLAKIISNRLQPLLSSLVGLEQVGFMPGREARDNIIKALLLTHEAHARGFEGLLLSMDMEKAFDRVAWDYMLATCCHVGLGPHMMTWIAAFYQNPSARLKINGTLSNKVTISNGTRQGSPLSPLLFILSLEPFIRGVNKNQSITGFEVANRIYKTAAYADELLFFLTKPHATITNLIKEFAHFGYISNLKINYNKSEAMNVTLTEDTLNRTIENCP